MKDSRQRRMVCTDGSPAPLTAELVLARIGAAALVVAGFVVWTWLSHRWEPWTQLLWIFPMLPGLALLVRVGAGCSKRWTLRLDRRGLTETFRLSRSKHYPWDSVRSIELAAESAVIHTTLGDIEVGPEVEGGRALAVLVKLRLDEGRTAQPMAGVAQEQVAQWLGVAPGEVVSARIRDETAAQMVSTTFCAGSLLLMLLMSLRDRPHDPVDTLLWLLCPLFVVSTWSSAKRCRRRIDATAERLRVHCLLGKYDLAWSDLLSIRYNGQLERPCWVVQTLRGRFTLHEDLPGAEWLANAIERATTARREGAELPRMSEVSDAAISPVSASVSAERGVSRADEPLEGRTP